MELKVKLLIADAKMPTKAHDTDAGFDFYATNDGFYKNGYYQYNTGVAMEIPVGYVGLIFPRSSISDKNLILTNCVGVIDSGYRGEIAFRFKTISSAIICNGYRKGDKIGQMIIMPYPEIKLVQVTELADSVRGVGGFGSSDR